ncbi:MAG: zinc-ribbon domain-containing protein [Lachnospiraceae bacterium]
MMSKKCVQCGHTLPDDASFCPHCTAVRDREAGNKNTKTMEEDSFDSSWNSNPHSNHRDGNFHVPQTESI